MKWLIGLFLKWGAGSAAVWIAYGLVITVVGGALWATYDNIYAAPRREIVELKASNGQLTRDLEIARGNALQWQTTASSCSKQVEALGTRCTTESRVANKSAMDAATSTRKRLQPLISDALRGPEALNEFQKEAYK